MPWPIGRRAASAFAIQAEVCAQTSVQGADSLARSQIRIDASLMKGRIVGGMGRRLKRPAGREQKMPEN
jgi:hypothetical protein